MSRNCSRELRRCSAPTTTSPGGSRARAASIRTGRSKFGLVDIATGRFDPELVALAGIAPDRLPPIRDSQEVVGRVTAAAAAATGLKQGTPVVAGCADLVASAFLAGAVADGDMVLKFGGSGDILLAVAKPLTDPRLYIDHHLVPGLWFSNGCMAASGSLLNWIAREWAGGEAAHAAAAGLSIHAWLDRLAAATPTGADGTRALALCARREDAAT